VYIVYIMQCHVHMMMAVVRTTVCASSELALAWQ
jgi:hypothetical protein